ncbi:MAG: twin-arginine translocase TatA/TatE family subunit [Terricaulis sp.]
MHMPSLWGLLIVLGLAFLLFGRPGKISGLMEDLGKGIKGFRRGLGEADTPTPPPPAADPVPPRQVPDQTAPRPTENANGDRAQG